MAVHVVTAIGNNIVVRLKLVTALTVNKIEWIPHLQRRGVVRLGLDLCFSARVLRRAGEISAAEPSRSCPKTTSSTSPLVP